METGLLYAISAAISYGLLQGVDGGLFQRAARGEEDPRRAFSAGAMAGLLALGLGVLGVSILWKLSPKAPWLLAALALGGCLFALFCKENSPAKMAAGLLGSFFSAMAAAFGLGEEGKTASYLLGLMAAGLLAAVAGVLMAKLVWGAEVRSALDTGIYGAGVAQLMAAFVLGGFLPEGENAHAFAAVVCGITGGLLVEKLAQLRASGFSPSWMVLLPVGASLAAFGFYGLFGAVLAAVGAFYRWGCPGGGAVRPVDPRPPKAFGGVSSWMGGGVFQRHWRGIPGWGILLGHVGSAGCLRRAAGAFGAVLPAGNWPFNGHSPSFSASGAGPSPWLRTWGAVFPRCRRPGWSGDSVPVLGPGGRGGLPSGGGAGRFSPGWGSFRDGGGRGGHRTAAPSAAGDRRGGWAVLEHLPVFVKNLKTVSTLY